MKSHLFAFQLNTILWAGFHNEGFTVSVKPNNC